MSGHRGPPITGSSPPNKNALGRQGSISSLEQSLNMVSLPPTIAPVTIYPGPGARHANLAKADLEIVQRLQQLRGSGESVPTEDEMAERLAKLKGLPSDHYTRPSAPIRTTDTRTDQQKAEDLIAQALEETRLDARRPNTDDDLSRRLAELRGDTVPDPNWSRKQQQQLPPLESPGIPQGLDDIQEVAKLLTEASGSASAEASSALAALHADPQLRAAIAQSVKDKRSVGARKAKGLPRKPQRASYSSTSSTDEQERNSNTSDEEVRRKVTKVKRMGKSSEKSGDAVETLTREDEEEVSRIVNMYSQRAARKKNKKLTKKKGEPASIARKSRCEAKDSETDSSSELSESDLENLHSEKLSDSSD